MEYVIKDFVKEEEHMLVGFHVTYNNGVGGDDRHLAIDKRIPLVEGKTDEEYTAEALVEATPEIEAWKLETQNRGRGWDPDTNSFVDL